MGSGCTDHVFLTTALVGSEWSASRPGRFTPGERAPRRIGGCWVGPRAGLDITEKRKFLTLPGLELPSAVQPVASRYTDYAIPAPFKGQQFMVLTCLWGSINSRNFFKKFNHTLLQICNLQIFANMGIVRSCEAWPTPAPLLALLKLCVGKHMR
jgi:hypothetical protein